MKRCAHCRGRFGLIRYTAYRAFGSIVQFCCKKCERAYFDELRSRAWVTCHSTNLTNVGRFRGGLIGGQLDGF